MMMKNVNRCQALRAQTKYKVVQAFVVGTSLYILPGQRTEDQETFLLCRAAYCETMSYFSFIYFS